MYSWHQCTDRSLFWSVAFTSVLSDRDIFPQTMKNTQNMSNCDWNVQSDKEKGLCKTQNTVDVLYVNDVSLKLPSLFAGWFFWTFHNKSHNMKDWSFFRTIHDHDFSYLLIYMEKMNFCGPCVPFWSIFARKNFPQIAVPTLGFM